MNKGSATGTRFGRIVKAYLFLGELRRQKKKPHHEVFYVWVHNRLRAIQHCTTNELTETIREAGNLLTNHKVIQTDAEYVLDLLYKELEKRI